MILSWFWHVDTWPSLLLLTILQHLTSSLPTQILSLALCQRPSQDLQMPTTVPCIFPYFADPVSSSTYSADSSSFHLFNSFSSFSKYSLHLPETYSSDTRSSPLSPFKQLEPVISFLFFLLSYPKNVLSTFLGV